MSEPQLHPDTIAMGNLAYVLAALDDLDNHGRYTSGWTVSCRRDGDEWIGYNVFVSTLVAWRDGQPVTVSTEAQVDSISSSGLLGALADLVTLHIVGVHGGKGAIDDLLSLPGQPE